MPPQFLYHIHHRPGIIGPQIADIAQLAKVHFNGYELPFHFQIADTGGGYKLFEFLREPHTKGDRAKIGEIYLCFFHPIHLQSK